MQPRRLGQVTYDNTGRATLVSGGASGIGWAVCQYFAGNTSRAADRQAAVTLTVAK